MYELLEAFCQPLSAVVDVVGFGWVRGFFLGEDFLGGSNVVTFWAWGDLFASRWLALVGFFGGIPPLVS